uniref:Ran-GTPase activating protein 1 C-terminal domain-containing protein n=1 Tax=Clytia hemisphaerica TaxID=252671 RepID=A0A7M6DMY5_9CNID
MEVSFLGKELKLDNEEDGEEIANAIKNCRDMETLKLQGNTLGVGASKVISEALKQQSAFKKALWSDMYTGRLRSEIPKSLELLSEGIITAGAKLTVLDLSDNAFGPDGVDGIKKLLRSESSYLLHTLKLNNNGLGIGGGKILSEAFIDCHKSSSAAGTPFALKVFISGRNRLENEGAKALSKAFKLLGSLEEITMPQNGIRPEGVVLLADAFKKNSHLKCININDNTCTETGAKALADCIHHLENLETLNIGDCLVRDRGAEILAPSLAATKSLKTVILSFNEIRRDGAMAVVNGMKNKTSLELLNLDGNQLGECIEEIQDRMSEFNMINSLGPFDDNEEPDSDEENDNDEEDEEQNKSNIDVGDQDDLTSQIGSMGLNKTTPSKGKKACSVDNIRNFADNPSYKTWMEYDVNQRKHALKNYMQQGVLPSTDKTARHFVHICGCMENDESAIKEISECVLGEAFKDSRVEPQQLVTSLLVHMGLLKAETKVEKVEGLKGPLSGLENVILQEYFPRAITQYFIAFLLKPNSLLDSCHDERHRVLQKLYQK